MANRFARKTGNWNASDVWSDTPSGTAGAEFIPGTGDVAMANSYTVTINVDATCTEVRTDTTGGATTGGGFALASGVTLTANCYAGTTACVTFSANAPAVGYIVGNAIGGSAADSNGARNTGTGTLTITGNAGPGGTYSSGTHGNILNNSSGTLSLTGEIWSSVVNAFHGVINSSTGTINAVGNAYTTAVNGYGAYNFSSGTFTLLGNAYGGKGSPSYAAYNNGAGPFSITGNIYSLLASEGARNAGTGTFTVTGNLVAGASTCFTNSVNGTVNINGDVHGGWASNAMGIQLNGTSSTLTVTGNAFGGSGTSTYGVYNTSTNTVVITGNASGGTGSLSYGVHSSGNGALTVKGFAISNNYPNESIKYAVPGVNIYSTTVPARIGGLKFGSGGVTPISGESAGVRYLFADTGIQEAYMYDGPSGSQISLSDAPDLDPPDETDVRFGISYFNNTMQGSCHVPNPASVLRGTPVDGTVGNAAVSQADIAEILGTFWAQNL